MKKFLAVPVLLVSLTMLAACSGGGGGGGGPGPDISPISIPTKILWSQEAPLDAAAPNIPVVVDDADKKVTASKDVLEDPPAQEEKNKEKAVGYFVSNLDGTGIARLTPTKDTAVALQTTLAPNGDFFYFTPAGIWISNFKAVVPRFLISARDLFTKFDESAEMLLAWNKSLLNAVKNHAGYPSTLVIVPAGTEAGDYAAVLRLPISYTKKDSAGESTARLDLRYDSKTGTLSHIFPFMSSLKNNLSSNNNNIPLGESESMKDKSLYIYTLQWNPDVNKFTYYVSVSYSSDGKSHTDAATISYDPVTGKHAVIHKDASIFGDETASANEVGLIGANLIRETPKVQYINDLCFTPYVSKVSDYVDIGAVEAAKKTAACMQALLTGKTVSIKKAGELDITASVAKKEDLVNAIIAATLPQAPVLASIDMGTVKQFSPKPDPGYGTNQKYDIICEEYEGATKCLPKAFSECSDKDKCFKTYASLDTFSIYVKDDLLAYIGFTKKGDDLYGAIYAVDLATGKVTPVDKSDETTTIGNISLTPTSAGPLFVYPKTSSASFTAWYVYDPVLGTPKELTRFLPSDMEVDAEYFACGNDNILCTGISYDKKYAFINFKDEMDKKQTYAKELTSLYPEVTDEGDEGKGSKGAAKSAAKDVGSIEEAPVPAPQAGNILGEGWIKVSPDVEHKGISYELAAYDGFQAIWEGNKEGFKYLYWNEPFKDPTPKRIDPQGYNSDQKLMSLATGLGLSGSAVSVAPADLNAGYACGASTDPNATYCEDPTMVCVAGVCKDMYSCSADVPNGWCKEGTCQLAEGKYQCVTQPVCGIPCGAGQNCGTDDCGNSCGTCTGGKICANGYTCTSCVPNCTGKTCGSDDCGGSCGTCGGGTTCNANGQCLLIVAQSYKAQSQTLTIGAPTATTSIFGCTTPLQTCSSYRYDFTAKWDCDTPSAACSFNYQLYSDNGSNNITTVGTQGTKTCPGTITCNALTSGIKVTYKTNSWPKKTNSPTFTIKIWPTSETISTNLTGCNIDATKDSCASIKLTKP